METKRYDICEGESADCCTIEADTIRRVRSDYFVKKRWIGVGIWGVDIRDYTWTYGTARMIDNFVLVPE